MKNRGISDMDIEPPVLGRCSCGLDMTRPICSGSGPIWGDMIALVRPPFFP
jgi:hypothetical protein